MAGYLLSSHSSTLLSILGTQNLQQSSFAYTASKTSPRLLIQYNKFRTRIEDKRTTSNAAIFF